MPSRRNDKTPKRPGDARTASAAPGRPRRNPLAFAAVIAVVLALAGYFLWPAVRQSGLLWGPQGAEATIAVSMSGFSPAAITARVGEPVTIQLVNMDNEFHSDGGGWHQFAIDDLALDVKVPPLETRIFTFVPDRPGRYDFYCDVCCGGKANPYMHGTLTVEA